MEDSMNTDDKDLRTVAFRAPEQLVAALEQLASKEMCSMSHIARHAVLRELREHGLMTEPAAA
jgi:predicted transcriptional regulator